APVRAAGRVFRGGVRARLTGTSSHHAVRRSAAGSLESELAGDGGIAGQGGGPDRLRFRGGAPAEDEPGDLQGVGGPDRPLPAGLCVGKWADVTDGSPGDAKSQ